MKKLALSLLIAAYASASNWEKFGVSYERKSAADKQADLWREISVNTAPYGWYSAVSLGQLFVEDMTTTIGWVGDTFQDSWLGPRKKLIHSVGSVAQVKFVPVENSEGYTGIFEGADHGLIRMSLAKKPDTSKTSAKGALDNFTPGFGLKFLRDNKPSASMVAMYSVEGQDSWNFFKNDFSNHIARTDDLGLVLVAKKFSTATPFVQYVGLSDFAKIGQDGEERADFKFPFQLVFEPTLRANYPDEFQEDFQQMLAKIPKDTLLYKVHAISEPGTPMVHIGDLVMTTEFTSSYFGDRYLFFKHQDIREDTKLMPHWEQHLEVATSAGCPFSRVKKAISNLVQ